MEGEGTAWTSCEGGGDHGKHQKQRDAGAYMSDGGQKRIKKPHDDRAEMCACGVCPEFACKIGAGGPFAFLGGSSRSSWLGVLKKS